MTREEFQRILDQHGGEVAHPMNVDKRTLTKKTRDKAGDLVETEVPNPTPTYKYTLKDGTTVTAITNPDGTVEIVDRGTWNKPKEATAAEKKPSPVDKLEPITDPNTGRVVKLRDPVTEKTYDLPDAKSTAPPQKSLVEINGKRYIFDPSTNTTVLANLPEEEKKPEKPVVPNLPNVEFGQRQPGQRTDLESIQAEAAAFKEQLRAEVAAGRMSPDKMLETWTTYFSGQVKPKRDQAVAEINEYNARREAERQEDRARAQAQDTRTEQRQSGQLGLQREQFEYGRQRDARAEQIGIQKFGYDAGQDAVQNYQRQLPYRVGPAFGQQFSDALNTISRGGGPVNISADAFTFPLEDVNQLAEQGAARAIARLQGSLGQAGVAPAVQPAPAVAPAPYPGDPNAAAAANDPQVLAWLQAQRRMP